MQKTQNIDEKRQISGEKRRQIDILVQTVKSNPGIKLREIRSRIKKGAGAIGQAIRDAVAEREIEQRGKGKNSEGYFFIGEVSNESF